MKTKLYIFATVLILAALLLSGCTRAVARPTDTPAPTPEPAPAEAISARDAALAYIRQHFTDQAPSAGLAWAARRATPEQMLGAETYEFAAEGWVILISYPIVRPDLTIYKISVVNTATDFTWEGQVDVQGHVAAAPEGVLHALRATLGYLAFNEPDKAPDPYLPWAEARTTPEGIVGAETYVYAAGGWTVTVSYPVVAPSAMFYTVVVENKEAGLRWEATVDTAGQIAFETDAPSGDDEGQRVDGWIGTIVKLPAGSQFGQYFLRDDGEKYDIGTTDDAIRDQLLQFRWTGEQIRVWGTLFVGVPATEARHIEVSRIEAVPGEPVAPKNMSPFAEASASSALPADRSGTYQAHSAIDGSVETAWAEGSAGAGLGEWIMLTFPGTIEVTAVGLDVGYDKDADLFAANNRVKKATFIFSSGEQIQMDFADERGVQLIPIARAPAPNIETTYVKVIIDEVYPGSRYDDTCIAEIEIWGRAK